MFLIFLNIINISLYFDLVLFKTKKKSRMLKIKIQVDLFFFQEESKLNDEAGLWEESYKEHHDSKPNGTFSYLLLN